MNYKAQTTQYKDKNFQNTTPVFTSSFEAVMYAEQCADKSFFIADYRVVEVNQIATHTMLNGRLQRLTAAAVL